MKNRSKFILHSSAAAVALSLLCCPGIALAADASPSPKGDAKAKPAAAELDSKDKDFMMEAAKGGAMEVHMGQMATEKGQSAEVKKVGKTMVTDHTKANNELTALAKKKGVTLDTNHKMDKFDDAKFDHEYLEAMVKDHEKDIAAFEKEAKDGKDADVKGWAGKTLPTLKKHLQLVKDAQGKVEKKS